MTKKKFMLVAARLEPKQEEFFKAKMTLWKLSQSDTLRKIISEFALTENDPWRYLAKALAQKKQPMQEAKP